MAFPPNVHPMRVIASQSRLKHSHAIYAGSDWSLAVGLWDGNRALLIRWNDDPNKPLGNPVSHGRPTWFVLPDAFHAVALSETRRADPNRAKKAEDWLMGNGPNEWLYDADEFPNARHEPN